MIGVATSQTTSRQCYRVPRHVLRDEYGSVFQDKTPRPVPSCNDATLVSSQTTGDLHAPALDLDLPAAAFASPKGPELWLDLPCAPRDAVALLAALSRSGIAATSPYEGWRARKARSHRTRTREYLELGAPLGFAARDQVLASLAPTYDGPLETLLRTSELAVDPEPGSKPAMDNPWKVELRVPWWLVASSTAGHHHLYLGCELRWTSYSALLELFVAAGAVEPNYALASKERKATHLRLPGVTK